jgi:hypothetical protein
MLTKKIQPEGQTDESSRQGPLKLQGCNNHPHHPHHQTAPIFTTLPDPLAAQLVLELVRLRRKLTPAKWQMSYFSRSSVTGRPLNVPVASFVTILMSKLHGHSVKRARELLDADPEAASPRLWNLAARAHAAGCRTSADFEQWVKAALAEVIKEPVI